MNCQRCAGLMVEEWWAEVGTVYKCVNCCWVKMQTEPVPKCTNGKCPNPQQVDSSMCTRCTPLFRHRGEVQLMQHIAGEASKLAGKERA